MKAKNGLHFGVDGLKKVGEMIWSLLALLLVGILLFGERTGVRIEGISETDFRKNAPRTDEVFEEAVTLLIMDKTNETSVCFYQDMTMILNDMRVSFETVDISEFDVAQLERYQKLVLCISNLDLFGEQIAKFLD